MMTKILRRAAMVVATGSAMAATLGVVTTSATAATTDQYDRVRYMMCAEDVVDVDYVNAYGNIANAQVSFPKQDNGAHCGFYDFTETEEYGGYVSVSVVDDDGGPVSCTIWVDGRIVSKSNDNSSYYSYASCY